MMPHVPFCSGFHWGHRWNLATALTDSEGGINGREGV